MLEPMKAFFCVLILFSGSITYAQNECKVLMPAISKSYTGECKKGLAHGEGSAMGDDYYDGQFKKGWPNGRGKYTWHDGAVYEGDWSMGIREGKGTMYYINDSVVSGHWKDDVFIGEILIPSYQITRKSGVIRSSISKISETGTGFRVGVYLAGNFNIDLEGFTMYCESGEEFTSGRYVGIQNATVPYSVIIKYRTWNALHTSQSDVVFEFTINEPGTFEVSITN